MPEKTPVEQLEAGINTALAKWQKAILDHRPAITDINPARIDFFQQLYDLPLVQRTLILELEFDQDKRSKTYQGCLAELGINPVKPNNLEVPVLVPRPPPTDGINPDLIVHGDSEWRKRVNQVGFIGSIQSDMEFDPKTKNDDVVVITLTDRFPNGIHVFPRQIKSVRLAGEDLPQYLSTDERHEAEGFYRRWKELKTR